jgi:hypothetical protein
MLRYFYLCFGFLRKGGRRALFDGGVNGSPRNASITSLAKTVGSVGFLGFRFLVSFLVIL